jgi:uncharacterized protein (TIGR03083 family)
MVDNGGMAEPTDLAALYRTSRLALTDLVAGAPAPTEVAVPACPGWSVHDVVGHLVGLIEDMEAGRLSGPPDEAQTAAQVARWSGVPTATLLAAWEDRAPAMEAVLAEVRVWPAVIDVLSHEQDVRAALDRPGRREDPDVAVAARALLRGFEPPVPVLVTRDGDTVACGPDPEPAGPAGLSLATTSFEVLRFRMGRRSRSQMAAMAWSGDPGPVLDTLAVFGPSPEPILE